MKRKCSYAKCGERRRHHDDQGTPRGTQTVDVPDAYPEDRPVYCSITCACCDGAYDVRTGPVDKKTSNSESEKSSNSK